MVAMGTLYILLNTRLEQTDIAADRGGARDIKTVSISVINIYIHSGFPTSETLTL